MIAENKQNFIHDPYLGRQEAPRGNESIFSILGAASFTNLVGTYLPTNYFHEGHKKLSLLNYTSDTFILQ